MTEELVDNGLRDSLMAQKFECTSEYQHGVCGVGIPNKEECRLKYNCPFFRTKRVKPPYPPEAIHCMEARLVDYEKHFNTMVDKWTNKMLAFEQEGKPNDAFICKRILAIICENPPKEAQKEITSHVLKTQLPLFRNYYKMARDDVRLLRKIIKDHKKVERAKSKQAEWEAQAIAEAAKEKVSNG